MSSKMRPEADELLKAPAGCRQGDTIVTRVLVAEKIGASGVDLLRDSGFDVDEGAEHLDHVEDYDGLLIRSATQVDGDMLARAASLRAIGRAGVGVDNVDVEEATRRGIVVANAPESNVVTAAEHTMALLLALARNVPQAHASLVGGAWDRAKYSGVELMDKTIGVLGFGRIGQLVAERARGFGMHVIAYDPYVGPERYRELGVEKAVDSDAVYAKADFLTLHLPKTPDTEGWLNAEALAKCKDGVRILNVARGPLVVDEDLQAGLDSGKVGGAALDVFRSEPVTDHPLFGYPNVIVTPHLGASTAEATDRAGVQAAEQVVAALTGGPVTTAGNVPAAPGRPEGGGDRPRGVPGRRTGRRRPDRRPRDHRGQRARRRGRGSRGARAVPAAVSRARAAGRHAGRRRRVDRRRVPGPHRRPRHAAADHRRRPRRAQRPHRGGRQPGQRAAHRAGAGHRDRRDEPCRRARLHRSRARHRALRRPPRARRRHDAGQPPSRPPARGLGTALQPAAGGPPRAVPLFRRAWHGRPRWHRARRARRQHPLRGGRLRRRGRRGGRGGDGRHHRPPGARRRRGHDRRLGRFRRGPLGHDQRLTMNVSARGWWLEDAGPVAVRPPLEGDVTADVVVLGGGYTGMWAAWHLLERGARVVLLESGVCGEGPSGRNGGFVDHLAHAAPRLRSLFGDAAARATIEESIASVRAIGAWCEANDIDAWFTPAGQIVDCKKRDVSLSCSLAALGLGDELRELSRAAVRARCASPVLHGGDLWPSTATVHPARLARGLRAALIERGVAVYEHTRATALHDGPG